MAAIFEDSDASSVASSSDEEDNEEIALTNTAKPEPAAPPILGPAAPLTEPSTSKVITVVDLVPSDDEFGPRLPPTFGMSALSVAPAPAPVNVHTVSDSSSDESPDEDAAGKTHKRHKHKHKKTKSHKPSKASWKVASPLDAPF